MKKIWLCLITIATAFLLTPSCKKQSDNTAYIDYGQGTGNCRLIRATGYIGDRATDSTTYFYDDSNRINQIINWDNVVPAVTSLNYQGNLLIITRTRGATMSSYDSIILNNNGDFSKRYTYDPGGSLLVWCQYIYDAAGQLKARELYQSGIITNIDSFKWVNGDMVELSSSRGITYHYSYTNIPTQFFNLERQIGIEVVGRPEWKNKHMEQSRTVSTESGMILYDYKFDASGKIVTDNLLDTHTGYNYKTTLDYECHNP